MIRRAAMRPWSLTVRLGWRLAAVMLLAVLLAAAAVTWRAIRTVHDLDDLALQRQVAMIAARLPAQAAAGGALTLPADLLAPFRASDGDNVFIVYDGARPVAGSDDDLAAALPALLRQPPPDGFFRVPPFPGRRHGMVGLIAAAGPWRVMALQGREQTAVLLESLTGNFILAAFWLLLPIGLILVLVGVLTLRRGLRPIREVSAAAALVGPTRPGGRLPVTGLPRELSPLVLAMNEALARMEQALVAQRHFLAEAAHALRTPLAVLTARIDMLDERPEVAALAQDVDRMARLVGQLLRMGRLEGLPLDVTQPVDLHAVAVEAISALVPLGLRRGVEIALQGGAALPPIRGNAAALGLALTNLIENALAHAPAGSTVEVAIPDPATVTVSDAGPGVAVEHRDRVFKRFERGPLPKDGGAGLGLAIVAEIAAAHGGGVRVDARAGGGAVFTLSLGASSTPAAAHGSVTGTKPYLARIV